MLRVRMPAVDRYMTSPIAALVIDDERDPREVVAEAIWRAGYSVVTACDGREALALLQTVRPRVIFVDLDMPIMNGAEFRQAQRRNREWLAIPTCVLTGTNEEPQLDLAVEHTLHKPVAMQQLLDIMRRYADATR
jgi:CheY-like chemotaxis protein